MDRMFRVTAGDITPTISLASSYSHNFHSSYMISSSKLRNLKKNPEIKITFLT